MLRTLLSTLLMGAIASGITACTQSSGPGTTDALIPSAPPTATFNKVTNAHRGPMYLYVSNCCHTSNDEVTVYSAYSKKNPSPVATITDGISSATEGLFADSAGNLYVVESGANNVTVYPKGSDTPSMTYTQDLEFPQDVAVDSKGTVYVTSTPNNLIVEYPKGSTTPSLAFSPPGPSTGPVGLALDKRDNLYVTTGVHIYRFPAGKTQGKVLPYQIPGMYPYPCGLAFDSKGRLFVSNLGSPYAIYGFAGKSPTPFETITDGLSYPYFLGFAPDGSLYVPNAGGNDVTVYAPGSTSVEATFSQGISTPGGVAFISVK